ncbi:MAG: serine protease [Myxococcota bacterium]|jgi:secreted trypsin-like serine protease|nr:serine protease [Myxococcota bacterium]
MARKIVQLVLLTLLGCAPATSGGDKVVNGEASLIEDHPYIVSLQMFVRDSSGTDVFVHFCGASILSENLIVTAAHCLTDLVAGGGAPRLRVVAGTGVPENTAETMFADTIPAENYQVREFTLADVALHPGYSSTGDLADVAVIVLRESLDTSDAWVEPIALASRPVSDGEPLVASGWGATETASFSVRLHEAELRAATLLEVQRAYREVYAIELSTEELSAYRGFVWATDRTGAGRTDTCQGDSGGPLVSEDGTELVGITSFGFGSGARPCGAMGAYTSVVTFAPWIVAFRGVSDMQQVRAAQPALARWGTAAR